MDLEVTCVSPEPVLFPVLGALLHKWKTLFKGDISTLPGNRESSRGWERLFRHFGSFLACAQNGALFDSTSRFCSRSTPPRHPRQ